MSVINAWQTNGRLMLISLGRRYLDISRAEMTIVLQLVWAYDEYVSTRLRHFS